MKDHSLLQRRQLLQRVMVLAGLAVLPGELGATVVGKGGGPVLASGTRQLVSAVADTIYAEIGAPFGRIVLQP